MIVKIYDAKERCTKLWWLAIILGSISHIGSSASKILFGGDEPISNDKFSALGLFKEMATSEFNESRCASDVAEIVDAAIAKRIWAIRILDASGGQMGPNLIFGNNFWFGSKLACDATVSKPQTAISQSNLKLHHILNNISAIHVEYKLYVTNFTSPQQIDVQFVIHPLIHLGLCLPSSCPDSEMKLHLQHYLAQNFTANSIEIHRPQMLYAKELRLTSKLFRVPAFFALLILFLVTLVAGIMEFYYHRQSESSSTEYGTRNWDRIDCGKILNCFSLLDNFKAIQSTATSPNAILCVNGLRSISCVLIIVLHTNIYSRFTVSSMPELAVNLNDFGIQSLMYAVVCVDTFFVVSAYILTINFLRNAKLQLTIEANSFLANLWLFAKHVLHRYLRLTPLLIVTMLIVHLSYYYLDDLSPFDVRFNLRDFQCAANWWRNLLYVQNFATLDNICGTWLWYIANDFQYYLLFLALLFLYVKHRLFAKVLFVLGTTTALVITFAVCYMKDFTLNSDVMYKLYDDLYMKPWIRVAPYQAGVLMAYMAHTIQNRQPFKVGLWKNRVVWALIIAFMVMPIFTSSHRSDVPVWGCSLMYSLGKFIYGLTIGLVILLCQTGNGGRINTLLSHSSFVRFNKLTYGIYLIHPVIIGVIYGLQPTPSYPTTSIMVAMAVFVTVNSYLLTMTTSLLFEVPYQKLSNMFLKLI